MLIAFCGLPASGKTTLAAKIFANFKQLELKSELVVEQARFYIANKRINEQLPLDSKILLTDSDQLKIMDMQQKMENTMKYGTSLDTLIVSDSSTVNAALYLTESSFNKFKPVIVESLKRYDQILFCHSFLDDVDESDLNRIHSREQILALKPRSLELLKLCKENNRNTFELLGAMSLEAKYKEACSAILDTHLLLQKCS